jgi:O-antigen/teichoic acid export membrane protein
MKIICHALSGSGVFTRAFRGATWTVLGFGASQLLRLGSNLILTRLLFPEAFGLMAIVLVFVSGFVLFSDIGLGQSISQNKRGDDVDFLNTAWTVQVVRGVCLWLGICTIAVPVARLYNEPMLAQILPVAGFSLVLAGFNPTRDAVATRHLLLGRVMLLDFVSQAIGIVATVALAWTTRSVWSLVFGGIITVVARLAFNGVILPGQSNRFRWDSTAARELFRFGKWIFLSTSAHFMIAQGDKAILGKYLPLDMFGIYSIGFFLANFPLFLGAAVVVRIYIPVYREKPPSESAENFHKIRVTRFGLTAAILVLVMAMAIFGVHVVAFLYDSRYLAAGAIVVLISCIQMPQQIIGLTYDQAALAAGDSRRFFFLIAARATTLTAGLLVGVEVAGVMGAIVGCGLAGVLLYPLTIWLARLHGAWDPLHDAFYAILCLCFSAFGLWLNLDAIKVLATMSAN